MTDRSVLVRLGLDVTGYTSSADKAARSTGGLSAEISKQAAVSDKALKAAQHNVDVTGAKLKDVSKGLGIAVVGVGAAAALGLHSVISAASDMNETVSKTAVVFGQQNDAVEKWSQNSATAIGLSQQAALEAAATFGNLFVSMKIASPTAADMSTKLVNLAGDLASFNNVDPAAALEALRSGLVGEVEPLRKFGVNLSEAGLKQEALKLGLDATGPTLSANVKAQAAYALILEQTQTAQGDFVRTSSGLANSQRIAAAEFENTKAKIGQDILPAYNALLHAGMDVLNVFNGMPKPMQNAVLAIGAVGGAALVLVPRVLAVRAALLAASAAQAQLAAATTAASTKVEAQSAVTGASSGRMAGYAGALGRVALGYGLLVAAVSQLENTGAGPTVNEIGLQLDKLTNGEMVSQLGRFGAATGALDVSLGSMKTELDHLASPDTYDRLGDIGNALLFQGSRPGRKMLLDDLGKIDQALAGLAGSQGAPAAEAQFNALAASQGLTAAETKTLLAQLPMYRDALSAADRAAEGLAAATVTVTLGTKDERAALAVVIPTLKAVYDATTAAYLAKLDFADADAAATKTAKAGAKTHADVTAAMHQFVNVAQQAADKTTGAAAKNAAYRGELDKLRDATKPGSALRKNLDDLIAKLDAAAKTRTAQLNLQINVAQNLGEHHGADAVRTANAAAAAARAAAQQFFTSPSKGVLHPSTGGYITGPGSSTSDSIPAMVSNGEGIVNAAAMQRLGVANLHRLNAGGSIGSSITIMPGAVSVSVGAGATVSPAQVRAEVDSALDALVRELNAV